MRRGEIWWVEFDPTRGSEIRKRRPAVIVTADGLNRGRRTVVVVPLSTSSRPYPPVVVPVASAGPESVAVCDQLRAVDKSRLASKAGELTPADLKSVSDSLRVVLATG
ncbi:MAG: type II toxin-antitoxin system PemK/MazF family toxin [Thermodesulfobacteriota bacterium]|jgi:mRNA interferase MazF